MPDEKQSMDIAKDLVITLIQKDLITLEPDKPVENLSKIKAYLSDMYHLVRGVPDIENPNLTQKYKR